MSETGKFATTYKLLGTTTLVDDTSTLHCGDCHTVGQFKPSYATNADGSAATVAIGAHGSQNEYMLRNSNGSNNATDAQANMVCYLCHAVAQYGSPTGGVAANSHDSAISHTSGNDCNGGGNNNQGLDGAARFDRTFTNLDVGKLGGGGASNIFGNKCSNCHNSSDNKLFGGIHGNATADGTVKNVSYRTYSSGNGATAADTKGIQVVTRKPYRFLPGLGNFRYNGGVNSDAWSRKSIGAAGKSEKMGCYTLNGTSSKKVGSTYIGSPNLTAAEASGVNVSNTALATDNGILGSWGACTDHAGSSISTAGHGVTRTSIRPLTY
jgi:hypothetical protein